MGQSPSVTANPVLCPAADAAPAGRCTSHHHPCWLSDTLPEPDSAGAGGAPRAHSRSRGCLCLHLVTACAYIAPSCSERAAEHALPHGWYAPGGGTRGDVPWYAACAPDPSRGSVVHPDDPTCGKDPPGALEAAASPGRPLVLSDPLLMSWCCAGSKPEGCCGHQGSWTWPQPPLPHLMALLGR